MNPGLYSEPSQTSKIELSKKIALEKALTVYTKSLRLNI